MSPNEWFIQQKQKPICVGTGLIALDVIVNGDPSAPPKFSAGGTCGNVLTILSYLGWKSYPIAKLNDDIFASTIVSDMKKWNVDTSFISKSGSGSTPIVVQKIKPRKNGSPHHRFEFICPQCGSRLPRFKAVPEKDASRILGETPLSQVFFFDRGSSSILKIAESKKQGGALIVFEPSGVKNEDVFWESVQVADIVKYSHAIGRKVQRFTDNANIAIEIETYAEKGLRFRKATQRKFPGRWKMIPSYRVERVRDTAGAGDWCTAGIIHILGKSGLKSLKLAQGEDIEKALRFGQALAALNCIYEGARGAMYPLSKMKFKSLVQKVWDENEVSESWVKDRKNLKAKPPFLCPNCPND